MSLDERREQQLIALIGRVEDLENQQYILAAGSRAFTGEQSMGTNKLTNVVDPTSNQDAATKKYVDGTSTAWTVTTGNVALVEGSNNNLTIAGLTANRQLVFPVPTAIGKEITITVLDGNGTYVTIPIGATTVTLNGGAAATALTSHYLFIANETTTWVSTSLVNWQLKIDGRIPCVAKISGDGPQVISTTTTTTVTLENEIFDNGGISDEANDRITIRRPNKYQVLSGGQFGLLNGTTGRIIFSVLQGATVVGRQEVYGANNSTQPALQPSSVGSLAAGDNITFTTYQNSGNNASLNYAKMKPFLAAVEMFE